MQPYFSIQWHITDLCDQRCRHCYIFSEGHEHLVSAPFGQLEPTYAQIKAFCAQLGRTPYIYLTGGDPILHPDFWKLLELFRKDGTRFCVMGNPFHLTDEACERMRACGCMKYQLSLDGMERTHDAFRKDGSFRATLAAIPVIRRSGMWCTVMSTVSKVNMEEILALIDLVAQLGVDVYAVGRFLPDGDVYACRRMSSRVGNVNTDDLYELWTTKMEAYRAVEKFDKCSRCPLKYICRGCPAVAYGYTHDMYAADPQCWREVA